MNDLWMISGSWVDFSAYFTYLVGETPLYGHQFQFVVSLRQRIYRKHVFLSNKDWLDTQINNQSTLFNGLG